MKNEKLIYSIGNISDKFITEADPTEVHSKKSNLVALFRKHAAMAAAIAAFMLLCAFTVYVVISGDLWIQKPSNDPTEVVRTAIENQVGKDYTISIEVKSVEVDEAETARVVERFISGVISEQRGWSDEYLAEHFVVVKAVYYAEYDRTQTTRSDGNVVMFFYLTRDIDSGDWTIVDNSGNVNWSDDLAGGNKTGADIGEDANFDSDAVISTQEQVVSYLSELFTEAYATYYDGLHFEINGFEESILEGKYTATFLWTMYHLGKSWDIASDEGVEQQVNFNLQASAVINDEGALDLSTISILVDESAVGSPDYRTPVEEYFPKQLAN